MWQNLIFNLLVLLAVFGVFVISVTSNITISLYKNTTAIGKKFDYQKLKDGIIKMLSIGLTTAQQVIIVAFIPCIPYINTMFTDDGSKQFAMIVIFAKYAKAIKKYYTEAENKSNDILENRNIIDDINGVSKENVGTGATTGTAN